MVINGTPNWMTPIIRYLKSGTLPEDRNESKKVIYQSSKFSIVGDDLYRRSVMSLLLKCIDLEDADYALMEVYEGICGNHSGGKTLALKILR